MDFLKAVPHSVDLESGFLKLYLDLFFTRTCLRSGVKVIGLRQQMSAVFQTPCMPRLVTVVMVKMILLR